MKLFYTLFLLALVNGLFAQVDFENYELPIDTFINEEPDGFVNSGVTLPNFYNANYNSFSGFALSTMTDTETPGYLNQYSSASGSGADASLTYAVGYVSFNNSIFIEEDLSIKSLSVNNTTYAYLSMRDGDNFAKKFGGETGEDPDYFLLTIKFFNDGVMLEDTVDFYLADYRDTVDYIVGSWSNIDLSSVQGEYNEIKFCLSSTDNGAFGMNTPAYIAIDNLEIGTTNSVEEELTGVVISPNPANEVIKIEIEGTAKLTVYNSLGQLVNSTSIEGETLFDVQSYQKGMYYFRIESQGKSTVKQVVKN